MHFLASFLAGALALISSWFGASHTPPPVTQTSTSSQPSSTAIPAANPPSPTGWATTTFDGLVFSYPPDWTAELYSSDKSSLYLDLSPSATNSPIVDIQVHSDSNSNSEFKGGSIEFAQQNFPSAGYVEMPDICIASINTCAKVWQGKDFQTAEYPNLTYLIPITGDVLSIDPSLHFEKGKNDEQSASVKAFLLQFLNSISPPSAAR